MPNFKITSIGTVENNRMDVQHTAMAEFHPVNIEQPEWVSRMMSEYFQP